MTFIQTQLRKINLILRYKLSLDEELEYVFSTQLTVSDNGSKMRNFSLK